MITIYIMGIEGYTLEEWIRETNEEVISERLRRRWKKRNL